jgi:hypothetical protein
VSRLKSGVDRGGDWRVACFYFGSDSSPYGRDVETADVACLNRVLRGACKRGGDRRFGTIIREVAAFGTVFWIHKAVGRASNPKKIRGEGSQLEFKRDHWMVINHRILQNPRTEIMEAKNEVRIRGDISFGRLRLDWIEVERKGNGAGDSGRSGKEAGNLERACFGSPPFSDSEGREAKGYWERKVHWYIRKKIRARNLK